MPLPQNGTTWPLPGHEGRYARMRKAKAYWAGVPGRIMGVQDADDTETGGPSTTLNPGGSKRLGAAFRQFWSGRAAASTETDSRRHLPLPEDIATIGAELLFSEALRIRVDGPTYSSDLVAPDGTVVAKAGDPTPETQAAQQRIERCLQRIQFGALLLAAAESGNVLGSSTMRVAFDKAGPIRDQPMIVRTDADAAFPEYQWGMLTAVTFWSVRHAEKTTLYRLLERHDSLAGTIEYGLYKGDAGNLGQQVPVSSLPSTAGLAQVAGATTAGFTIVLTLIPGGGHPTAVSIPNMLPDPLDSQSAIGRSDFRPTTYSLFNDADKAYTDLMDELDDAKSRLLVADALLERRGAGRGLGFDPDQRVFRLNAPPSETGSGNLPIVKAEFSLRTAERLEGLDAIRRMAIESAGYDRAAMGDDDTTGAMTATEVRARRQRSLSTRDKKAAWWKTGLSDLLTTFLQVDTLYFPSSEVIDGQPVRVNAYPVTVEFVDAVQPAMSELLADAAAMRTAEVADDETAVRYVWRDLNAKQVDDLVRSIQSQRNASAAVEPLALNPGAAGAAFVGEPGVLDTGAEAATEQAPA